MTNTIAAGTPVRFTDGPLGLIRDTYPGEDEDFVVEGDAQSGDLGVYSRPVLKLENPPNDERDWHWIKVGELFCPVLTEQFEVLDDATLIWKTPPKPAPIPTRAPLAPPKPAPAPPKLVHQLVVIDGKLTYHWTGEEPLRVNQYVYLPENWVSKMREGPGPWVGVVTAEESSYTGRTQPVLRRLKKKGIPS